MIYILYNTQIVSFCVKDITSPKFVFIYDRRFYLINVVPVNVDLVLRLYLNLIKRLVIALKTFTVVSTDNYYKLLRYGM